ncbi:protein SERAC1, partial [Chaetomidium leptoderma]
QALSYAQTRTGHKVSHDYSIFSCTYGILFFGTPHHGSSKATWLDYLKKLGAAATLGGMSRKSDLVSALENESETLQNITDYFVPIMRHFHLFFFWEQSRTSLGPLGSDYIVTHESAAPAYDETERAAIAADHRGMVRFETPSSQGFRMVVDALIRYCDDAAEVVGQRRADAARTLALERSREAAETLRNTGSFFPRSNTVPPPPPLWTRPRVQSGFDDVPSMADRTTSFRTLGAPDEGKME